MFFNWRKTKKEVVNHEGAKAYALTPELELYTATATALLADTFYENAGNRIQRLRDLVGQCKPEFVAKLAIYAREQMHLRSVPALLTVELARKPDGGKFVARTVYRTVQRADEIAELLACYASLNHRTDIKQLGRLSKQLQKGLGMAFNRFDEYQFAKYDRDQAITLRDALFLVHPKPKDEAQQALFDKIAQRSLAVPYTWEVELSRLGQIPFASPEERRAAIARQWEALLDSGKLGYMALLRNLRNLVQAGVSAEHIRHVCQRLADPAQVARARQMPVRYLAAYRELQALGNSEATGNLCRALEAATRASVQNLKGFATNTRVAIACDVSGSMGQFVSFGSRIQLFDIGVLLAMVLRARSENVLTGIFGTTWKEIPFAQKDILSSVKKMHGRAPEVGYETNGHLVLRALRNQRKAMDKLFFFTDCQLWDSQNPGDFAASMQDEWTLYKKAYPTAKLYLFDMVGYGKTPLAQPQPDVFLIAGWSDKVFDALAAIEEGGNALSGIEAVALDE